MARTRLNAEDRREQLLEAAIACLREGGLEALTLQAISRRCGTSIGLIARYFENRAGLLAAIYKHIMPDMPTFRIDGITTEDAAISAIHDFIEAHFATSYYARENLSVWTAVFSAVASHPRVAEEYLQGEIQLAGQMTILLDHLGVIRNQHLDSTRISKSFLALLDGLWLQHALAPQYMSADDAKQFAITSIKSELQLP